MDFVCLLTAIFEEIIVARTGDVLPVSTIKIHIKFKFAGATTRNSTESSRSQAQVR